MAGDIHDTLADRFGDALRSVGYYDGEENELLFVRDDIEAEYDDAGIDRVFQEARLEALDQDHQESLFTHGNLEGTVRCFEEATELHVVEDEQKGVVVAVDAGAITDLRGSIDAITE